MSFSAEWLALREPVDHRSVDAALRARVAGAFADRPVRVLDLGCGSGSNLRGLAPLLGPEQRWTLVDWDAALLSHAGAALTAWADDAVDEDDLLVLLKDGQRITVEFLQADLAADVAAVLDEPVDLVTAAAFFDLVSEDWIATFCDALAARKLPLYTVLTYDGREVWTPPHESDAAVLAAFHAHQSSDKGFGPAAGPRAADALAAALTSRGYDVQTGPSPWRLDAADQDLIEELADGSAGAAAETGLIPVSQVEDWLKARMQAQTCEVGHLDIFAKPR